MNSTEVWLASDPDCEGVSGTGSASNPLRIKNAWFFDGILCSSAPGTVIRLLPGTFQTRGCWNYAANGYGALAPGCALLGSGQDETRIELSPEDALFESGGVQRNDTNVLWIGPYEINTPDIHIADLTIDGRCQQFPAGKAIGGLRVHGSRARIERVIVTNIRGVRPDLESFGIAISNPQAPDTGIDGDSLIDECAVETSDGYVTAFYPGFVHRGVRIGETLVSNCHAEHAGPEPVHAAFSFNRGVRFTWCKSIGYANSLYNDTGEVADIHVEHCELHSTYSGLSLIATGGGAVDPFKYGVRVSDTQLGLEGQPDAEIIGVVLDDHDALGTRLGLVQFHRCQFRFRLRQERPPVLLSARGSGVGDVVFLSCHMPSIVRSCMQGGAENARVELSDCAQYDDLQPITWPLPSIL